MKTIALCIISTIMLACSLGCKKTEYPQTLEFVVIDSFSRLPIRNASVELIKVWRDPVKIGDNSTEGDWFPEYGRKLHTEIQSGKTNEQGKLIVEQKDRNYLYIIPGVVAEGYQMKRLDTLFKPHKNSGDSYTYTLVLQPKIRTSFILKSHTQGMEHDSVVFTSCDAVKVLHGAQMNDRLEVMSSNYSEAYCKVWYAANIYRNGEHKILCSSVISYPNKKNEFEINID